MFPDERSFRLVMSGIVFVSASVFVFVSVFYFVFVYVFCIYITVQSKCFEMREV